MITQTTETFISIRKKILINDELLAEMLSVHIGTLWKWIARQRNVSRKRLEKMVIKYYKFLDDLERGFRGKTALEYIYDVTSVLGIINIVQRVAVSEDAEEKLRRRYRQHENNYDRANELIFAGNLIIMIRKIKQDFARNNTCRKILVNII